MKVTLNGLPKASLKFIEPMLARTVERLPAKGDWLYEVKLDGYRALAMKNCGTPRIGCIIGLDKPYLSRQTN